MRSLVFLAVVVLAPAEALASGEFVYPQEGRIRGIGYFGAPRGGGSRRHQGIDIAGPLGSNITSARGGVVEFSGRTDPTGYGTLVTIDHGAGYETRYAHMRTLYVRAGERVATGQRIGLEGVEGNARFTEPHLHFEVRRWGVPQFIPGAAYQAIRRHAAIPRTYGGLAATTPPPPQQPLRAWINKQGAYVNVRARPDTHATILGQIKTDRTCVSHGSTPDGEWLAIDYKGRKAWIWRQALQPAGVQKVLRVKVARTGFLEAAARNARWVGEAHQNEVYPIHGWWNGFYSVDWGDIHYAWMDQDDVWQGQSR